MNEKLRNVRSILDSTCQRMEQEQNQLFSLMQSLQKLNTTVK